MTTKPVLTTTNRATTVATEQLPASVAPDHTPEPVPHASDNAAPPATLGVALRRRNAARVAAVQAVYRINMSQAADHLTAAEVERIGEEHLQHLGEDMALPSTSEDATGLDPDADLFRPLLVAAWEHRAQWDTIWHTHLTSLWKPERTPPVMRAILQVALADMLAVKSAAPVALIQEYLFITDAFFSTKEASFVNGILDSAARAAGVLDGPAP